MIKTKIYSNGLKLVVEEMPSFESCSIYVMVKTGSVNETEGYYGISHFIEHMLFKGTKKRNSFQITKDFASIGASVNAFTSNSKTAYYTKCVADQAENCAEILSDMFFNSVFDEKEMNAEKQVVCEEIAMYQDNPNAVCETNLNKIFYNGTEYSRDIGSTQENVKSITRDKILEYTKKNYTPKNCVISFAGNISFEKAQIIVEKYFLNNFTASDFENLETLKMPNLLEHQISAFKDNKQAVLTISYPGLTGNHPNQYVIKLLNYAFGVGMSSRLFQKIREELGLVYSIYSDYVNNDAYGDFTIFLSTTNKNVPLALSKIKEEVEAVASKGITLEEFERAKIRCIASLKMSYENTSNVAATNATKFLKFDITRTKEETISNIEQVTLEEVNKMAKEIFLSKRFAVSYVGPQKEINLLEFYK